MVNLEPFFDLEAYLLLPLFLVLFLMALPILSRKVFGKVTYILAADLSRRRAGGEDIAVLDLRPKKQFDHGHIEDAINVTAGEVEQRLGNSQAALELEGQTLVFVCASDLYSTRLAGKLGKKGVSGVKVLKGGMYKWKRDHQPVV